MLPSGRLNILYGMDIFQVEEDLRQACAQGDIEKVEMLISTEDININARDNNGNTALYKATLNGHFKIVELLLCAGAELEIPGTEDRTALMNAALTGNFKITSLLIQFGAQIPDELISAIENKVDVLQENFEEGMISEDTYNSWKSIFIFLYTQKLKQNLPMYFKSLKNADIEEIKSALEFIESAYYYGLDITNALDDIKTFLISPDFHARNISSAILATLATDNKDWNELVKMISLGDIAVQQGVMSGLVSAARIGMDVSCLLSDLIKFLKSPSEDIRHDTPIVLGYLATSGYDVRAALMPLVEVLKDESAEVRQMTAWALYRFSKYLCNIQPAIEILTRIRNNKDEDSNVRNMAAEAIEMNSIKW
jgi:hypothetical protein